MKGKCIKSKIGSVGSWLKCVTALIVAMFFFLAVFFVFSFFVFLLVESFPTVWSISWLRSDSNYIIIARFVKILKKTVNVLEFLEFP